MFPQEVQDIIAKHLVEVYSNVAEFSEDFVTQLMQVFGGEYSDGVDLGLYSRLSKLLQESDLLDMDTSNAADIDIDIDQEEKTNQVVAHYSSILQGKDWDQVDIELVAVELKSVSIELFMRRMRRFRGGADLHGIAARLPENCSISYSVKQQIMELTELLKRGYNSLVNSLKKIKQNQTRGGDRVALLNTLATKYNNDNTSIKDKDKMDLVELLAPGRTPSDALQMIKNTAAEMKRNGERLTLLCELASQLVQRGEPSITPDQLQQLQELTLGSNTSDGELLQMIKNTAEQYPYIYKAWYGEDVVYITHTSENMESWIGNQLSLITPMTNWEDSDTTGGHLPNIEDLKEGDRPYKHLTIGIIHYSEYDYGLALGVMHNSDVVQAWKTFVDEQASQQLNQRHLDWTAFTDAFGA